MIDSVELFLFIILTAEVLFAAIMCISVRSPTNAAVWLITMFVGIAGFYVLLNAEFLGMVQLIVYSGGIAVLILFSIMLSGRGGQYGTHPFIDWRINIISSLCLLSVAIYAFFTTEEETDLLSYTEGNNLLEAAANLKPTAINLFDYYWPAIIILGFLLLASMLGAVYLVKKEEELIQ
jgi:NADH-quinone oxidoreductase subunit J